MMKKVLSDVIIPSLLDFREKYLQRQATGGQKLRKDKEKAAEPDKPVVKPKIGLSFDGEAAFFNAAMELYDDAEMGPILKESFVFFGPSGQVGLFFTNYYLF